MESAILTASSYSPSEIKDLISSARTLYSYLSKVVTSIFLCQKAYIVTLSVYHTGYKMSKIKRKKEQDMGRFFQHYP